MPPDDRSESTTRSPRPLVLIVIDGWGCAPDGPANAIALAKTPVMDRLWESAPHTTVEASGVSMLLIQLLKMLIGELAFGSRTRVMFHCTSWLVKSRQMRAGNEPPVTRPTPATLSIGFSTLGLPIHTAVARSGV